MHPKVNKTVHISFHAKNKNAARANLSPLQKSFCFRLRAKGCLSFLVDPGQQFVILAEELTTFGHKLVCGEDYSELACCSCARQVV